MGLIRRVRRYVLENTPVMQFTNKCLGVDYALYDRLDIIEGAKNIAYYETKDGVKYNIDGFSNFIPKYTQNEYDWSDLKPDDIVLEFGATVGDQTIRVAKKVKHVYAVEPIYTKELVNNLKLNGITNVTVIPYAIGDGISKVTISHNQNIHEDISHTPKEIIESIPEQITFIKCDIDGYEWHIQPSDLNGVRRIEMEVHPFMFPKETYNPSLIPYIKRNYRVNIDEHENRIYIIHAYKLPGCNG